MKRSLFDIFKREYEVRLSVSGRDVITAQPEQWGGVAVLSPGGDEVFRAENASGIETAFALLRELRPKVLRIEAESPDLADWLSFCCPEEISPHLVFMPDASDEMRETAVRECLSRFTESELWKPVRFYEISCDPGSIPFDDDEQMDTVLERMKAGADQLRKLDPDARIILGGILPAGDQRFRAEAWNLALLGKCGRLMDMIGVPMFPRISAGCSWDEDAEGIEVERTLAEELGKGLQTLDRQIREPDPDTDIRIAVTGWGFRQDGVPQKRQDCVFWSSVYTAIRASGRSVGLHEFGPLFGKNGLLTAADDGRVFGNVFYQNMLMTAFDPGIPLKVKETENEKGIPVYNWEGIPGAFDGGDIPLLEIMASRSPDGKRIFLFLTNRSPFKLAVPRIRFYDMPDMHPIKACILRSKKRLDENTPEAPQNIICKEVKLRNYRKMDHVTLEIPECSSACMLLE